MPRYEYACNICGHREDQVRTIANRDEPRHCPVCLNTPKPVVVGEVLHLRGGELAVDGGIVGLLHRDVIASMRVHADMGYQQPILSEALAIHPSQIPEARQRFPHHEYTPDGRMVLRSHTQRNQVLRELGFHDRGK
jgi:putative FmdB family regulatory protein